MARLTMSIEVTVLVQPLGLVSLPPFRLSVEQGQVGAIPLTIRNDGAVDITYIFVSTAPEGIDIAVLLEDGVYTRTIAPGAEDTLDILFRVARDVPPAPYTISIALQ